MRLFRLPGFRRSLRALLRASQAPSKRSPRRRPGKRRSNQVRGLDNGG